MTKLGIPESQWFIEYWNKQMMTSYFNNKYNSMEKHSDCTQLTKTWDSKMELKKAGRYIL